ncbi:hypothetical protein KP509_1Z202600 [Ceratopteris richardii]|nr:hypothetical protein KP509_1Z202600 [Ceratopteris richardii]
MAVKKKDAKPDSILCSDLVTIGDSWLQLAISDGLIQPIKDAESQEWFNKLGANWKEFARRNHDGALSQDGLIWGVPYRWGTMVIAYKKDRLSRNNIPAIEDWKDLWRPELKGQISMVDSPREVVGIVLKSLGASYNAQDFEHDVEGGREAVKQQFSALHEQVKVFDNIHYLKAFGLDDVWVAVGWSCDLIPVAKRMSYVNVVVPKSGASLWADFWAIPAGNAILGKQTGSRSCEKSPLIHQWLNFCLQPARSLPFRQGTFIGYPPFFLNCTSGKTRKIVPGDFTDVVKGMVPDSDITDGMLPKDGLERSEMLEPLSEKALAEYRWLFSQATEWHTYTERGMFARSKNSSN